MGIIAWVVFGIIAGFIASKIVNKQGEGVIVDCILGIVGAMVGGWLYGLLTHRGFVMEFDIGSMVVAVIGAIIVLVIYHAVTGRRATY